MNDFRGSQFLFVYSSFFKMASLPYHESDVIYFHNSIRMIKLDTVARPIISVFEDSPVLFLSSEVSRPPLKNYQLASPLLRHHKLNHGRCHPCPISTVGSCLHTSVKLEK